VLVLREVKMFQLTSKSGRESVLFLEAFRNKGTGHKLHAVLYF